MSKLNIVLNKLLQVYMYNAENLTKYKEIARETLPTFDNVLMPQLF